MTFETYKRTKPGRKPEPPRLTFDASKDRMFLNLAAQQLTEHRSFRLDFDPDDGAVRLFPKDGDECVTVTKSGWISVRGFAEATGWGDRRWELVWTGSDFLGAALSPTTNERH